MAEDALSSNVGSRKSTAKPAANTTQGSAAAGKHAALSLDVNIYAPLIVLPQSPFLRNAPYIEVHLGHACARSCLVDFDPLRNYDKVTV
jgi:hypothetical protein